MCEATRPLIVLPLPHFPTDFHLLSLQGFLHHLIPRLRCHADLGRIPTRGRSQGARIALCAHPVPSAFSDCSHVNAALTADFPVLQLPVLYVVRSSLFPIHATHSFDRLGHTALPTDRRLRRRHLCCLEHTSCQERDQPT